MGTWTPSSTKLPIISVYAPQELPEKRKLWGYISSLINRWYCETAILDDFNKVRMEQERFESNGFICMKKKLQLLKNAIKTWIKENKRNFNEAKLSIQNKLKEADKAIDQVRENADILNQQGDENSKYFHGILNSKRSQLAIHEILKDGDWIVELITDVTGSQNEE
uniref:RNA-directed DNA polymerase, eukaryota n=1 Tax=Tanacetum cinerariifolium TaxID=118510 RepID=A0A6L2M004_TANCI|nr:RNA-directed DNA polymerase, eukaryota [Tanacetum cinerariifolium]